eukprot:c9967_g1_i1.p1 GENE.c9967_g1_i1~~c9967_g1_i1.p1  ORF type:complete len:537 (-),score=136.95 c9967_g1_i1:162-1772(-)
MGVRTDTGKSNPMGVPTEGEIMAVIAFLQKYNYKDTEETILMDIANHGHDYLVPQLFTVPEIETPAVHAPVVASSGGGGGSSSSSSSSRPAKEVDTRLPKEVTDWKHTGRDEWADDDDLGFNTISVDKKALSAQIMEDKSSAVSGRRGSRPDIAEEPTSTKKPTNLKTSKMDIQGALTNGKKDDEKDSDKFDEGYDVFYLKVYHRRMHTGFEESKDFPIRHNDVVAGRYQVVGYIGSAAFSKAIQCVDLVTGSLVCLKVIKNNKDYFDQSLDEVKLIKYINAHDPDDSHHILQMFDFFYFKEHLFIVCELLRENLYEFSKYNRESEDEPYFTMPHLQRITRQVLTALAFIHSLKLIHCDLKPENILIQSYSRCVVRLIDFGSSCFTTDHLSSYVQSRSYRAPEVILGLPYDGRIDVWSMGCVLPELFTGSVVFQSDSAHSLLARIMAVLGPFSRRMLTEGRHSSSFFTKSGLVYRKHDSSDNYEVLMPRPTTLEARMKGADKDFVEFVKTLLTIDPDNRPTAAEALKHPWLNKQYS